MLIARRISDLDACYIDVTLFGFDANRDRGYFQDVRFRFCFESYKNYYVLAHSLIPLDLRDYFSFSVLLANKRRRL